MYKGKLHFTVGRQRSGKSTYCKLWLFENYGNNYESCLIDNPRVIVSGDAIRLATHGMRYNRLAEDSVFMTLHTMVRTLLITGFDVIVDETNTSEISIRRLLEIDNKAKAVYINTSEEICIQRALDTNQPDLVPVIKRVGKNIEKIEQAGGLASFMNIILEDILEKKKDKCLENLVKNEVSL